MIFARRSIQRFLDQLSETLSQDGLAKLVRSLNRNDQAALGFEWETAVLFAFAQFGDIEYEANHGGEGFPDVTFRLPSRRSVCFVADVTTVSDRGLEVENPVRMLADFLHEKAKKLGMAGGFQYRVEGAPIGERYENRKVKLAMPARKELRDYLERQVTPRLREIKETGLDEAEIPIDEPYRISISYRRAANVSWGSHLSYTAASSLTRNPLHTSLKEKARQLHRSGFEGCKGVILCDGYCQLLASQLGGRGTQNYNDREIIEDFLRDNSSISFVVTLWVEQPHRGVFDSPQGPRLRVKVVQNSAARFPLDGQTAQLLTRMPDVLPIPVNTAASAAYGIAAGNFGIGKSHYGGSKVSYGRTTSIRISSRALLDLLAGTNGPVRFSEDHWSKHSRTVEDVSNPFAKAVAQGMTIAAVAVERMDDEDDDWVTFELSWPDPAVTPFRHSER